MDIDWSKAPAWAKTVIASRDALSQLYWFECHIGQGRCQSLTGGPVSTADNKPPSNWTVMSSRPTKPEWVDGLPPEGTECEALFMHGATTKWRKCEVLRLSDNGRECAVYVPELNRLGWCNTFRPIQTPEQRQQEELQKLVWDKWGFGAHQVADAILQWMKDNNLTEK